MTGTKERSRWHVKLTRDTFLAGLGVFIILHELLIYNGPSVRYEFLLLATTLIGSVPFLQKGDRESEKRKRDAADGSGGGA